MFSYSYRPCKSVGMKNEKNNSSNAFTTKYKFETLHG